MDQPPVVGVRASGGPSRGPSRRNERMSQDPRGGDLHSSTLADGTTRGILPLIGATWFEPLRWKRLVVQNVGSRSGSAFRPRQPAPHALEVDLFLGASELETLGQIR